MGRRNNRRTKREGGRAAPVLRYQRVGKYSGTVGGVRSGRDQRHPDGERIPKHHIYMQVKPSQAKASQAVKPSSETPRERYEFRFGVRFGFG